MEGNSDLDTIRFFLEQAQDKARELAGSDLPSMKNFGRECHTALIPLIRALGQVEEKLRNQSEPTLFDKFKPDSQYNLLPVVVT